MAASTKAEHNQRSAIATDSKPRVNQTDGAPRHDVSASNSYLRTFGPIIALLIVWFYFAWSTNGIFLTPRNFSNLIRQTAVTGLLAVGMTIVLLTGEIDLSVGSIVGLSGMAAVVVQVAWHAGLVISLLTGILVGLAIGILQGVVDSLCAHPLIDRDARRIADLAGNRKEH